MKNLLIKISVLLLLLAIASTNSIRAQENEDEPIKVNTVLLNVPVIASDRNGRNVAGLKKENFSVFQEREKQTIEFFADAEAPMNVAILIDTSGSTRAVLGNIKEAARAFVSIFGAEDRGMIVSFDHKMNVLTKFTSDQGELRGAINSSYIAEESGSNMYDPLYKIIVNDFASIKGRKAIIVLTDGHVDGKLTSKEQLLNALIESDTTIYPIFFQTTSLLPSKIKTITMDELLKIPPVDFLNEIALATGGRVYAANGSNFESAFQKIVEELKKQYVIGFYPTNAEGGKSAPIKINVDRKDVVVRTKRTIRLKTPDSDTKEITGKN